MDSIHALGRIKTPESCKALMVRFTFRTDPTITDQEEKDEAFQHIVEAGDLALEPAKEFLKTSATLAWPMRILDALCGQATTTDHLFELLAGMQTDYERDPDKKIQTLQALEDRTEFFKTSETKVADVARFLDDTNETARFYALRTLIVAEAASGFETELLKVARSDESLRIRTKIFELAHSLKWSVPLDFPKGQIPKEFALDPKGLVLRAKK